MNTGFRSFSVMYSLQRVFLIIFFLISVLALFGLLFYLLHDLLKAGITVIIPFTIAYLVLVTVLFSFLQVITYIPANLPGAFDPVKNEIARQEIKTAEQLAVRLAEFITSFFNFAFFDIEYTLVRIQDKYGLFPEGFSHVSEDLNLVQLENKSREINGIHYQGKVRSGGKDFYMYIIPLVFGKMWLGYMAVLSRRRLWGIFQRLLEEFENDFVDDQVVHVLAMNPDQENALE